MMMIANRDDSDDSDDDQDDDFKESGATKQYQDYGIQAQSDGYLVMGQVMTIVMVVMGSDKYNFELDHVAITQIMLKLFGEPRIVD